ncbi:hypothetical protein [Limnohabitans sp.]|uniref:hypothetical protein n=1 Tax=Limnohabitans sp. TaxID=1907725 RepID=UPI0038BD5B06
MKYSLKNLSAVTVMFGALTSVADPVWAGRCGTEMSAVDQKIRKQYGEDLTWWTMLGCPVCLGAELRKDAIVTKAQIKEISFHRNIAYVQLTRGNDQQCVDALKIPKRMLRLG